MPIISVRSLPPCLPQSLLTPLYIIVTPDMNLLPSAGSDRAWVYTVNADFADEEAKVEQLAIRFKNTESKFDV